MVDFADSQSRPIAENQFPEVPRELPVTGTFATIGCRKTKPMKTTLILTACLLALPAFAEESADVKPIVTGNTAFALELYGQLRTQEGNLFLSPYSISTALAMTYGGARGATEKQMAKTLHFGLPQEQLHLGFAALQSRLNAVQQKGKIKLAIANSLWPHKGYDFLPAYLDLCQKQYGVAITPVDFNNATESARKTINDWVENKTNRKIQELFKPGILDARTRLVLANAIYFKGTWTEQFDKKLTRKQPFHLTTDKTTTAPLMHRQGRYRYAEYPTLQVLELPYAGNDLSMIVLLPVSHKELEAIEAKWSADRLAGWLKQLHPVEVDVYLPQFKMASQFSLNQTLAALGMTDAFTVKADFSGMDGQQDLFISAVIHKAFVEVNEEGTEAAAATGVAMEMKSEPAEPVVFRADRPFLFLIRDNPTGSLLFLGRVTDPTK